MKSFLCAIVTVVALACVPSAEAHHGCFSTARVVSVQAVSVAPSVSVQVSNRRAVLPRNRRQNVNVQVFR